MTTRDRARIPSLDGLRALSIAVVLLGHLAGTAGSPPWINAAVRNSFFDIAHFGVRVFFVISGFLITGLLVVEQERTGTISLKQFYFRRTLRIFPAYFALLGVLALLALVGALNLTRGDFLHAVTYTMNYSPDRSWQVGHLWSLAVEEQFYLLWPAALLLIGLRRGGHVALAAVLLAPLIRVAEATFFPSLLPIIGTSFETTADALAMGCLLALWQHRLEVNALYQWALASSWWLVPVLIAASIVAGLRYRPGLLVGDSLANLAVALLIARSVAFSTDRWGKFLNLRPMVLIGTLSYSLYLWQQLFLNRNQPSTVTSFPLNLALACICAVLSYNLVERPVLKLRSRIAKRPSGVQPAAMPG
jgi:peptidoglycan/LPS O-acetylase OafA/YrhL